MKTLLTVSAIAVLSISILSCNKVQVDNPYTYDAYQNKTNSGNQVVDDDWNEVSKIPLIISKEF